jgi:hypothetical protein
MKQSKTHTHTHTNTQTHKKQTRHSAAKKAQTVCKTRATSSRRQKQATRVGKEELKKLPILLSKEESFTTLRADQRGKEMEPKQQQEESKSSAAKWSQEIGSSSS